MTFTPPPAAFEGGAQVAAEMALARTAAAQACVCRHARSAHLNRRRCLDRFCDCRQFTLPEEPDPDDTTDLGT